MGLTESEEGDPAHRGIPWSPPFSRPLRSANLPMADAGEDPTIFTARCLPSDPRLWATVTNAYLGTRVYHDTLHVNGVYNGALGDTHRASVPSPLNVQLEAPAGTGEQLTRTFVLDTNTGSPCRSCPPPLLLLQVSGEPPAVLSWHFLTQDARCEEKEPQGVCLASSG